MSGLTRRKWLATSTAGVGGVGGIARAQPVAEVLAGRPILNVASLGADPRGVSDSAPVFQLAIDKLAPSGGVVYVPAGTYRIGSTLVWANDQNARRSGILFQGDGPHSSIVRSFVRNGPLVRIRGVPEKGPISTTFFWGGGIRDLAFDGRGAGPDSDAMEVLGWWYGEIFNCRFTSFPRHAVRAVGDLVVNPNPDFSASTLFVRGTWFERCGGFGFIDDGSVQSTPAWSWDRCVFVMCRQGGAQVRSSSHSFTKCSFSGCGWSSEAGIPAAAAYGLWFDGAATSASRQWVEGCEFDNNLTAHIGARFLSASSFVNNRFIFNDRFGVDRLCPPIGVEIGSGDAHAAVRTVEFRQNMFRFDRGGEATGFMWKHTANVRDVSVDSSLFIDNSGGSLKLVRYKGYDTPAGATALGYRIHDRDQPPATSIGRSQ